MRLLPLGERRDPVLPPSRNLFRPTAPALKKPRYAGRATPDRVLKIAPKAVVFEAPGGGYLLFDPNKRKRLEHEVKLLEPADEAPRVLDVGRVFSPYTHAWSTDGKTLFGVSRRELWRCDRASLEVEVIEQAGDTIRHIAVAGDLLAIAGPDSFTLRRVEDGAEVHRERGAGGFVGTVGAGRFLLQSSLGAGKLFAVRGDAFELVASHSGALMGAWDEDGETYVNVSIDELTGRRQTKDLVATHVLDDLDDLYPAEWS